MQHKGTSKSEKFPPPHQDGAVGHPVNVAGNGPVTFGGADNSFSSSIYDDPSQSIKDTASTGGPSRRRKGKNEQSRMAPSLKSFRSFIPTSISLNDG